MTKKELVKRWKNFKNCTFDKTLFQEYITFCNYASEQDFNNYFKIEKLQDSEFFSLVDFFYKNKCYNLLYRLMRDNKERLIIPNIKIIKDMELREDLDIRMKRLVM